MPHPVYLLVGDPFLIEEKRKSLLEELRRGSPGETAVSMHWLSEAPLDTLLKEARTLPFFTAAQVLILREAENLKETDTEILEAYLRHPHPQTHLILESSVPGKVSDLAKKVKNYGEVCLLEDREKKGAASRLIQEKLRRSEKAMTPRAAARLAEELGDALLFLDTLLDQLIRYAGDQKEITESMVEAFHENWQEADAFQWANAVANRRPSEAFHLLRRLLEESGGEVTALIGLLHWQMRRLWLGRRLLDEGCAESEILKKCRAFGRQAPFFLRQLKQYSRPELERALETLFQLDRKVKTGECDGAVGLEAWTARLTAARA